MDERVAMMKKLEAEERRYYEKIQEKLRELFGWEMQTDEIEDFLEAVRQADVELGSGR